MASKLITILLPVKNAAFYLSTCLQSLKNQTYQNWELIAINDNSTDNSLKILKEFQSQSPQKTKIISLSKSQGLVAALNTGLKKINPQTSYVARLDADDWQSPQRLAIQFSYLEQNPTTDLLGTYLNIINSQGFLLFKKKTYQQNHLLQSALLFYDPIFHPTVMWRKTWQDQVNFQYYDQYSPAEDYHAWLKYKKQTNFATIPQHLYYYRLHSQQNSQQLSIVQSEQTQTLQQQAQQKFLHQFPNRQQTFLKKLILAPIPKTIKILYLQRFFKKNFNSWP